MQVTSSIANIAKTGQAAGYKVTGAASENKSLSVKPNSENDKKDKKSISMADSELVQKSNRIESIIKNYEKQKELVRKQIDQVNKNEYMTPKEKKDRVTELTDKIKSLEDEKSAAIFEENQKRLEEERRKIEEQKEKSEVKKKPEKDAKMSEDAKDMEHVLKIGHSYSKIQRFKQTKADMSREAGRIEGEIANDIVGRGMAQSYSEAKVKAAAGVNPYRDTDWKIKHYQKLTSGIDGLDKALKAEITEVNRESQKYAKLKVEFAKNEDKDENENKVEDVNEKADGVTEAINTEEKAQTNTIDTPAEENAAPAAEAKPENKAHSEAQAKYKKSTGKNIDKKGTVIDTDL